MKTKFGKVVRLFHRNRQPSTVTIRSLDGTTYQHDIELFAEARKFAVGTEVIFSIDGDVVLSLHILTPEEKDLWKLFADLKQNYATIRLAHPLPAFEDSVKSFARELAEEFVRKS